MHEDQLVGDLLMTLAAMLIVHSLALHFVTCNRSKQQTSSMLASQQPGLHGTLCYNTW